MFKKAAKSTLGVGCYSVVKTGKTPDTVTYLTKSEAKLAYMQYLGITVDRPRSVVVENFGGVKERGYLAVTVRRLYPMHNDFDLRDELGLYFAEVAQYERMYIATVRGMKARVNLRDFHILRPAIEFVMEYFDDRIGVCDDMHDENAMYDRASGEVIPTDVFNLEAMERETKQK